MESSAEQPVTVKVTAATSNAQFSDYTSALPASALLVVYFQASWAAPCQQMSAALETLAGTYHATDPPKVGFVSVDAEALPDVSERYEIAAVPFVVLQRDGKTLETVSGSDPVRLRAAVERHAGAPGQSGKANLPPPQVVTRALAQDSLSSQADGRGEASDDKERTGVTAKEDLHARLTELVKAAPVMLFLKGTPSVPQCGFSRQVVGILRERGIRYGFFNILADDDVRQGLKEFAEWPTYPQLWVDGELVGGLDILKETFEDDPSFLTKYSVRSQLQAAD